MQTKNIAGILLLAFVLVALGWALLKPADEPAAPAVGGPAAETSPAAGATEALPEQAEPIADGVIAYYLHPESRCATCLKIEELSKMALDDGFPEALAEGRLQWLALNMDRPENRHFKDDFELITTSLVLAERKGGETVRFKNCSRVWELVHSPMKFDSYVTTETAAFLGES